MKVLIVLIGLLLNNFAIAIQIPPQSYKLDSLDEVGNYRHLIKFYKNLSNSEKELLLPKDFSLIATAFKNINREDSALHYFKVAKNLFTRKQDEFNVALCNLRISSLLQSQNNLEPDAQYFDDFWEYATKNNSADLIARGYNYLGRLEFVNKNPQIPLGHFKNAYKIFDSIKDIEMATINRMNIGVVYSNRMKDNDSARYHYFKSLEDLIRNNYHLKFTNLHHDLLNNIGNSYRRSKMYDKALVYYMQAETLQVKKFPIKTKKILFNNMNATYYYKNDFEKAYKYLYKFDSIKDIISLAEQNASISDIEEKYDNEKLRADNLQIEAKRLRNRNFLIGALAFIVIGASTAVFIHKNTTKKRLLAEQQAELKQQRVDNLLKEQELISIDAMIAGQEKERQKVADELHDDLGSLMATIKLHFDKAEVKENDKALNNAKKLLEEAYAKVRGIAHTKNSGVMSDHGILPAIKKMADVISQTNGLEVEVEHYGMVDRLENSLELTIFRIIQELTTNILKHAQATKVSIQLTQHDDNLNIIVEDNGNGFDYTMVNTDDGMGLTNIEKRVEHLEGTFSIDSVVGKGTSILIDIPV